MPTSGLTARSSCSWSRLSYTNCSVSLAVVRAPVDGLIVLITAKGGLTRYKVLTPTVPMVALVSAERY